MVSSLLLTVCFVAAPPAEAESQSDLAASLVGTHLRQQTLSKDEFRSSYKAVIRKTTASKRADPEDHVHHLVALLLELPEVEKLSYRDRTGYKKGLEERLETICGQLQKRRNLGDRYDRRHRSRRPSPRVLAQTMRGGGTAARAGELIDLIQNTLAPDSWDVNGGHGTIRFWSLNPALVIRNKGEVHHSVGTLLNQLGQQ